MGAVELRTALECLQSLVLVFVVLRITSLLAWIACSAWTARALHRGWFRTYRRRAVWLFLPGGGWKRAAAPEDAERILRFRRRGRWWLVATGLAVALRVGPALWTSGIVALCGA